MNTNNTNKACTSLSISTKSIPALRMKKWIDNLLPSIVIYRRADIGQKKTIDDESRCSIDASRTTILYIQVKRYKKIKEIYTGALHRQIDFEVWGLPWMKPLFWDRYSCRQSQILQQNNGYRLILQQI